MENQSDQLGNITGALHTLAVQRPDQPALIYCTPGLPDTQLTFRELDALCSQYAAGLQQFGLLAGERVLILARPDRQFVPFLLGIIRAGGSVVFVDPGRPLKEMLTCIQQAAPGVLVAPRLIQAATRLLPTRLGTIRKRIVTDGRLPGATQLAGILHSGQAGSVRPTTTLNSEAALIFTTGSTGQPKGVVYTHATLLHQYQALQSSLHLGTQEMGLFGPSAMLLLGLLAGVTAVMADSLSAGPGQVDIEALVHLLQTQQATLTFASPLLCRRLVQHCRSRGLSLPALCRLMVGGAEVDADLIRSLQALLPNGDVIIALGATEIMPVALITGRQALEMQPPVGCPPGAVCIGFPAAGHEVQIIAISEAAIPIWEPSLCLPPGKVGEIVIRGPAVTGDYLGQPTLTARAKIRSNGNFWHRMGDLGCLDESGCLWLVGRKVQRVDTGRGLLFTLPCEAVFNRHPSVARSALVGLGSTGSQTPVMVIEAHPGQFPRTAAEKGALAQALRALATGGEHTHPIQHFAFYPASFPVDIRHQSKILREKLALWVARNPSAVFLET